MPSPSSLPIGKFSSAVESAVKAALEKHPKLRVSPESSLSLSYLIWGIPVPEEIAGQLTIRETQAFANDIARQLDPLMPGRGLQGAVFSRGGHLIIGIPAPPEVLLGR